MAQTVLRETTVDGQTVKLVRQPAPDRQDVEYEYWVLRKDNTRWFDPVDSKNEAARLYFKKVNELEGKDTGYDGETRVKGKSSSGRKSLQDYATAFSTKVNKTVKGSKSSKEKNTDDSGGGFGALFGGGMDSDDEGSGPMLPGFGMQETDDDDEEGGPMLPGFGGGNQEGGPMLPGMAPPSDDEEEQASGPMVPGFGNWDDPDNDDDGENEYNFPGF